MKTRQNLIDLLKPLLMQDERVLTVWEGGSAATSQLDAFSDLDLMVVANKKDIESLFEVIEKQLDFNFGMKDRYRMPEPAWHGFSQCFYQFEKTEPWLYLDLCLLPEDLEDRFTACDRHGMIEPWKDTIGFIDNRPTAEDTIERRAMTYYQKAITGEFVLRLEIDKALRREHVLDATHFLHSYLMRHLAPLLNLKHRKAKVDFGIRYAKQAYPIEDYTFIETFFQAGTVAQLRVVAATFFERFETLKMQFEQYKTPA